MKKFCAIFLMLLCSLSYIHASDKIPLEKAITDGIRLSYEFKNNLLNEQTAELQRQRSEKQKLFHVDFNANYLFRSETMVIDTPSFYIPGMGTLAGQQIEAGLKHNYDMKLSAVQPLFTGGILSNTVKTEELRKAVEANRSKLKQNEIAARIKTSFFNYLYLIHKKESLAALQKTLNLHQRKLKNLFREGLVKKSDILETLSRFEELNLNIADIEQAIESERIHFINLCSYDPEEIDKSYTEKTGSREESLSYFKHYHPILKTLQNQIEMLTLKQKILAGKYLPQVNSFAELHYGKPGIDFFKKEWSFYFQGGITLNLPVFNWNRLKGDKKVLDIQIRKLDNQQKDIIKAASKNLEQLYAARESIKNKLSNIAQLIDYSREDAELKAGLYQEKQIPNIDLLTALSSAEKYPLMKQELLIQLEQVKVNINTLISLNKAKEEQ